MLIQMYLDPETRLLRWRALGGNHREIARGTSAFLDVAACVGELDDLRASTHDLEAQVVPKDLSRWEWMLTRDATAVATSAQAYDRRQRCAEAARRFRAGLAEATVLPMVLVNRRRAAPPGDGRAVLSARDTVA
jgi:hypothetical protein